MELLTKHPTIFSADFDANKKALEEVALIRNRVLRNQIAGAITAMIRESAPPKAEVEEGAEKSLEEELSPAASVEGAGQNAAGAVSQEAK